MTLNTRSNLTIFTTFVVAFILVSLPSPDWAEQFRPDWISLVLIYWCLATPNRVGVGVGWTAGLLLDVLYGSLLGQQALAKSLIAFLTLKLHLRVRMFPPWQQAMIILLLLVINHLIVLWAKGIAGHPTGNLSSWTPSIVGMAIWPVVFTMLRKVRRYSQVS